MTEKIITENTNSAVQVFEGKKRTNKKPIIGIDPLAWLKEKDEDHIEEREDLIQQGKIEESLEETAEVFKAEFEVPAEASNEQVEDEYLEQTVEVINSDLDLTKESSAEPVKEQVKHESDEVAEVSQGLAEDDLDKTVDTTKLETEEAKVPINEIKVDDYEEVDEAPESEVEEVVESSADELDGPSTEAVQITDQQNDTELEMQTFKLEGTITIADVAELHDQFKTFNDKGQDLEINCAEISSIDAAALQLLVVFMKEADKKGNKVLWQKPSDSFQATLELMGFKDEFRM